jgi:hypothetical protein
MPNDNNNERKIPNNPTTTNPNQKPPMPDQRDQRDVQRDPTQRDKLDRENPPQKK